MRIGINASFLRKPGTGIGNMTLSVLRELGRSQEGRENEYILYLEEDADISFLPENFQKRIVLPFWRRDDIPRKWLWERFTLPRAARQDGCGAFVSLYQSGTIFPESIPHTMVVHDIIPELFPEYRANFRQGLLWQGVRQGMRRATRIVAVSQSTKSDLVSFGIPSEKIAVAYQGLSEAFRSIPSDEQVSKVLGRYGLEKGYLYHGGGLEIRKNGEGLLRAYAGLGPDSPQLVVSGKVFAEGNPLAFDIVLRIRELGLEGRVKTVGFVPEEDLPSLYRGAIAFAYPSSYEGFGLPLLEAMAMGVPSLASRVSSLPEVGGDACLYCDPSDPESIREGLERLLSDAALRQDLSAKALVQARKFGWQDFAQAVFYPSS